MKSDRGTKTEDGNVNIIDRLCYSTRLAVNNKRPVTRKEFTCCL